MWLICWSYSLISLKQRLYIVLTSICYVWIVQIWARRRMSFARLVEIHGHAVFLFIIEWTVSTWWWNKQCYVSIYQMHTYSEIFYFLRSLISWNYNFVRDTILTVHSSSGNRCTIAIVWSLLNIIWSFPSKMNNNNTSKFF